MSGLDAHLVVRRDDGDPFTLDIELSIAAGETLALLGPNGAGKSTTVNAIAGLVALDAGHIRLDGRTLDDPVAGGPNTFVSAEQRRIGVVFQDYLLFDHLTVLDNVMFGPLALGRPRAEALVQANALIEAFDLVALRDRRPPQLSGGQAQRVAIARALATTPDMLLLDEALAALDIGTRNELRRTLGSQLDSFVGPRLLITHDPTDAFLLADRIAVIEDGRITQSGTPESIRRNPATTYVAAVAGTNLLQGDNQGGTLRLSGYERTLETSDTSVTGPVLITIHPTAIALHREQPQGSARNSWQTTVAAVEPLGDTTRVMLADPLPLAADITPASTAALALAPGTAVWASVKATEVAISRSAT